MYLGTSVCTLSSYASDTDTVAYIKGDVNADGEFNVADIVLFKKYLLAVPDVELKNWIAADLCQDDRLNVLDMIMMKNALIAIPDPVVSQNVQPIHFENVSALAKEINDYDLDKYSLISREGYRKMYDTIKNDGSIYEVKVNETVNIDLERGIAVVPNAKYEDLGIYSYTKNDFQIIVYYTDKGTEHNGIADYFTKRFNQNILKEISVNGKETVISEFGITDDTRRISASAFIDDSHYFMVKTNVGGTEDELIKMIESLEFKSTSISGVPDTPIATPEQPVAFKDTTEMINVLNADKSGVYDTIKKDNRIIQLENSNVLLLRDDLPVYIYPYAKYEDFGICYYIKYNENTYQQMVYYISPEIFAKGISDYLKQRFNQNILKEISVNGEETAITEFGITDDTRRICASAFIDDSHYYTVKSYVGGTEEELTDFLNNMTFVNVPIA